MANPRRFLLVLAALLVGALPVQAQFVWGGQGTTRDISAPANWRGRVAPPNDGTAVIEIGESLQDELSISTAYSLNRITISGGNDFTITAPSNQVITLTNGLASLDDNGNFLRFTGNIDLNLSGAQTFDARGGTILVYGRITGTGPLTLVQTSATNTGAFIFSNPSTGNTYTGGTTLGNGVNPTTTVAFWNSSPFGTGPVSVTTATGGKNVNLTAHGTQTLTNAFTLSGTGNTVIRSWDAPLTFSGAFTLASNSIISPNINQNFIDAPNGAGSIPIPGFFTRPPIVFTGGIGESGGARVLTVGGSGIGVLAGINTYTGGTTINGSLIFSGASSVPATGAITVNTQGYAGFLDATPGAFAAFLASNVITAGSGGSVGVDTPTGSPTSTFVDAIDLSPGPYYNSALRIGTATRAILTGTITPQTAAANYQFGNGGGTLYVQSNLTLAKGLTLQNTNTLIPLTVYLQGSNTYTGATSVSNGFLIFDSATALSPATTLTAGGSALGVGESYIGYTDVTGISSSTFLGKFTTPVNTWGIIGFDTNQFSSTATINGIDLTGFNDGVFIGTTTSAIITGALVPTTVTNGNNAANTLRFTAGQNGILTVNSTIGGTTKVMLGTPTVSSSVIYSSGTVIMNSANTYTGGTILNAPNVLGGLTLSLGNSAALGSGPLTITSTDPANNGGAVGISAFVPGINLPNAINFVNLGGAPTFSGPRLYLSGPNDFILSGNITGDATTEIIVYNTAPTNFSLAGNNSGFLGSISVYNGTLTLLNNNAAGLGTLNFGLNADALVTFGGAATAPVLYGINGDGNGTSTLDVPLGTNLTFDVSNILMNDDHEFGGTVSGLGSLTITAGSAIVPQSIYLYGDNIYSGGTTITDKAILALGRDTAAGSGPVTVNATSGGIILNSGVTFTNVLNFNTGALMGFGTFQPPSGSFNITSGRSVAPGIGGLGDGGGASVGLLHFIGDVTFGTGGTYDWALQDVALTPDPSLPGGYSLLAISGNLNITATAGGFVLNLFTYDSTNNLGLAALPLYVPYSLPILIVSGTITGFDPSAFTINAGASFQNGTLNPTVFSLSNIGNTIYLDFTPIPEPSTYALFSVGLVSVLLPVLRRRRRLL